MGTDQGLLRLAALGLTAGCLLAGAACDAEPDTRVDFHVRADETVEVAKLEFLVFNTTDGVNELRNDFMVELSAGVTLPVVHPVVPRDGDASRSYRVLIRARNASGEEVGVQTFRGTYVEGRVVEVPVLFSEACRASLCHEIGLRCDAGSCLDPYPTPETAHEPPTSVRFIVDADPAVGTNRVVLGTVGSAMANFDAPLEALGGELPLTFLVSPEGPDLGPFTTHVTYYGAAAEANPAGRQTVRWSFTRGERRAVHVRLDAECVGSLCPDFDFRCMGGRCVERCVGPVSLGEATQPTAPTGCGDTSPGDRCIARRFIARDAEDGSGVSFSVDEECHLGCEFSAPVCRRLQPSNLPHRLVPPEGGAGRVLQVASGTEVELDTVDCAPDEGTRGEPYLVCEYDRIFVESEGHLRIPGRPDPVVLLVATDVVIHGGLTVGSLPPDEDDARFRGGEAVAGSGGGGAGGSLGGRGGAGGDGAPAGTGGAPNPPYDGPSTLEPLPLGGYGGDGSGIRTGGPAAGSVQISAGRRIAIVEDGSIEARGGNGKPSGDPPIDGGGGGGGSGGAVLLEAPEVRLRTGGCPGSSCRVLVNGGAGGGLMAGRNGGGGSRGLDGGDGASETRAEGTFGEGGGGGAGIVRINAQGASRFDYEGRISAVWGDNVSVGPIRTGAPSPP